MNEHGKAITFGIPQTVLDMDEIKALRDAGAIITHVRLTYTSKGAATGFVRYIQGKQTNDKEKQ